MTRLPNRMQNNNNNRTGARIYFFSLLEVGNVKRTMIQTTMLFQAQTEEKEFMYKELKNGKKKKKEKKRRQILR